MRFYYSKKEAIDEEINNENKIRVEKAFDKLLNNTKDPDILSWMNTPINNNTEEYSEIFELAEEIKETSQALVVLGPLEGILPLKSFIHSFSNDSDGTIEIIFFSNVNTIMDLDELLEKLKDIDFSLFYFSQKGEDEKLEASYEVLRGLLEIKYSERQAGQRVFLYGENDFFIKKNINDRIRFYKKNNNSFLFSIFESPMLLPLIVDGIDVSKILDGALTARNLYIRSGLEENDLFNYLVYKENIKRETDIHYILSFIPKFLDNLEYIVRLLQENSSLNHLQIAMKDPEILKDKILKNNMSQNMSILVLNLEEAIDDIVIPGNHFSETYFELEKRLQNEMMTSFEDHLPLVNISIERREEDIYGKLFYFIQAVSMLTSFLDEMG